MNGNRNQESTMKISDVVTVDRQVRNERIEQANYKGHQGCHLCGKAIKTANHFVVALRFDEIVPMAEAEDLDDHFAVGSSCAKRIPATHKRKV
jgi:hypothetical protein